MTYCFDLDLTLCITSANDYAQSVPIDKAIREVNRLYDNGHRILIFTARGSSSGIDYRALTEDHLRAWGLKYHELILKKPSYDIIIDDKAINAVEWRQKISPRRGLIAGSFDLIHPGYVLMFQDAKSVCDHLIVALQDDPTIDRPDTKLKPVQTLDERKMILASIRYVDQIETYSTEAELYELLKRTPHDIRILGSEYKDQVHMGWNLGKAVHYHERKHEYSTTRLKHRIHDSLHWGR